MNQTYNTIHLSRILYQKGGRNFFDLLVRQKNTTKNRHVELSKTVLFTSKTNFTFRCKMPECSANKFFSVNSVHISRILTYNDYHKNK